MARDSGAEHQLHVLEHIESNPDTTQAAMATQVGVAIGTANWAVRRLLNQGHVRATHLQRRRMRYSLTAQGLAEKSRLTVLYMQRSLQLYREVREQARAALRQVKKAGHAQVVIEGEGDLADICRLTCLEQCVAVTRLSMDRPARRCWWWKAGGWLC